jgi:hypothetical protein
MYVQKRCTLRCVLLKRALSVAIVTGWRQQQRFLSFSLWQMASVRTWTRCGRFPPNHLTHK